MMSTSPLHDSQLAFAAHLRDPTGQARPADVPERRMAVYLELFHNNLDSMLASSFPVLRKVTDNDAWHTLLRDFAGGYRARSPLYPELPREFVRYLDHVRPPRSSDPPFLAELAHHEWVELALAQDPTDLDDIGTDPSGDWLALPPVLSPLAWPLSYRFPVHRIGPDYLPDAAPDTPTHLLCYRDRADHVHFMQLNAVAARLLALLREHPERSGQAQLQAIAKELQHPHPQQVLDAGQSILADLCQRDVILGTRS